ncbi:MAG: hypothetical protein KatS3mg009_0631 [Acidimicrobiia bacterium]|nr:MAG: hypothetical protein KatS3mg009_0631 [Acidimicrobiia bacterium]
MPETPVTFSVIIPTSGRKSLPRAIASAAEQLEPGDEILVLCDRTGDRGNTARQQLVERARGTHLVFIDDDDQFARDAFAVMRRFATENPGRVGIFRFRLRDGTVLWREPELRRGNVGTPMYCVPNVPGKVGSWLLSPVLTSRTGRRYTVGDYEFIRSTVELQGPPVFRPEIVAYIRSDRRALRRAVGRVTRLPGAALRRLRLRLGRARPAGGDGARPGR